MELRQLAMPVLQSSRRGLLSISLEAPLAPPDAPPADARVWQFWQRPAARHCLLGLGLAHRETASGSQRFSRLDTAWQDLRSSWTRIVQGHARPRASAFLGFAFDPDFQPDADWRGFDNAVIHVPRLLAEWRRGRCIISFNCRLEHDGKPERQFSRWMDDLDQLLKQTHTPEQGLSSCVISEEPSAISWQAQVADAVRTAEQGGLDKVVLSRRLQLRFRQPVDHRSLLPGLARCYPGCTILSLCLGGDVLLAATPEQLLRMNARSIHCDALAGTLPVHSQDRDADMETHEHAPVVTAIRQALQPFCRELRVDQRPGRLNLNNLAHLYTAIRGELRPGSRAMQVLDRLHPTPAVGGMPRKQALEWMGRDERQSRGWYTGGFGWLGDGNQADLSVLLRCARIQGNSASLYAGAGITRVSDPQRELRETELKFEPMLRALTQC